SRPPRWFVAQVHVTRLPRDVGVALADERFEFSNELGAGDTERVASRRQLGVPDVQCELDVAAQATVGLLEQRVALPDDAFELDPQRVVLAMQRNERRVEELASVRRPTLDQREVVGGEDADTDDAEQVAPPRKAL